MFFLFSIIALLSPVNRETDINSYNLSFDKGEGVMI